MRWVVHADWEQNKDKKMLLIKPWTSNSVDSADIRQVHCQDMNLNELIHMSCLLHYCTVQSGGRWTNVWKYLLLPFSKHRPSMFLWTSIQNSENHNLCFQHCEHLRSRMD